MQICVAAVYVTAHLNGERSDSGAVVVMVVQVKIGNRPAVGDKMSLKAPLAAQNFADEQGHCRSTARRARLYAPITALHFAFTASSKAADTSPQILLAHLGVNPWRMPPGRCAQHSASRTPRPFKYFVTSVSPSMAPRRDCARGRSGLLRLVLHL